MTTQGGTELVATPTRASRTPATLSVLQEVFARLDAAGIRYCHWKSNEHLAATMTGATDVDVLVERDAIVELTRILGECGFKRFVVKPGRGYPGIEDYVGFDPILGLLTHFHVHYQLTLGEKFLKGHRPPWEELYFETRVRDAEHGVYVAEPHLELIVLVVRQALKLRWRDLALAAVGVPFFRGGMQREFRWLAERVEPQRLVELATKLLGESAARLFPGMLAAGRPSTIGLRAVRRKAWPRLQEYRLESKLRTVLHGWRREWSAAWFKLTSLYRGARAASTRTLPNGGIIVAVLGADGAGKSTVVSDLTSWLAREASVTVTYGGSGTGSAGLPRRAMQALGAGRRALRPARHAGDDAPPSARRPTAARAMWVLALASERTRRAREARRARSTGRIVIADRLAQRQFPGMNDGPRLESWLDRGSRWQRWAARREQAAFRLWELTPPNLVIKLHVPADVALQRKPETPRQQVLQGIELVRSLRWAAPTRVVDLDATRPLDEIILEARRAVWEAI